MRLFPPSMFSVRTSSSFTNLISSIQPSFLPPGKKRVRVPCLMKFCWIFARACWRVSALTGTSDGGAFFAAGFTTPQEAEAMASRMAARGFSRREAAGLFMWGNGSAENVAPHRYHMAGAAAEHEEMPDGVM